jgi:L-ascorbate metabolism protein UlaG (beta-lactamase superfamily)
VGEGLAVQSNVIVDERPGAHPEAHMRSVRNLRAGGMDEADAMKITGHTTSHRHYDICDVDALRDRLTHAREQTRARPQTSVTPIRAQS